MHRFKSIIAVLVRRGTVTVNSLQDWLIVSWTITMTKASQITSLAIVHSTVYSRRRSKKSSKLRVTGLCEENSPVTGEFPAQRATNAEMSPFDDVIITALNTFREIYIMIQDLFLEMPVCCYLSCLDVNEDNGTVLCLYHAHSVIYDANIDCLNCMKSWKSWPWN